MIAVVAVLIFLVSVVVSAVATFPNQTWTSAVRLTFVSLWRGESP